MTTAKPLTYLFQDDGKVPNNSALPVLVYKGAVDASASAIETRFSDNGWGNGQWRNGIYPFVHYHSMIHETLGIARGHARVQLGGGRGEARSGAPQTRDPERAPGFRVRPCGPSRNDGTSLFMTAIGKF